jgi:hypothetical protein
MGDGSFRTFFVELFLVMTHSGHFLGRYTWVMTHSEHFLGRYTLVMAHSGHFLGRYTW